MSQTTFTFHERDKKHKSEIRLVEGTFSYVFCEVGSPACPSPTLSEVKRNVSRQALFPGLSAAISDSLATRVQQPQGSVHAAFHSLSLSFRPIKDRVLPHHAVERILCARRQMKT